MVVGVSLNAAVGTQCTALVHRMHACMMSARVRVCCKGRGRNSSLLHVGAWGGWGGYWSVQRWLSWHAYTSCLPRGVPGLASPKSQIFSLQSELARMFLGFRSLWKTLAAGQRQRQRHGDMWQFGRGTIAIWEEMETSRQVTADCAPPTRVNVLQSSEHLV